MPCMSKSMDWLRIVQVSIAASSILLAIVILATAAHSLIFFHNQQTTLNHWYLPIWPDHFDFATTQVYIGASAAVIVLSVVYLSLAYVPKLSLSTKPKPASSISLSFALPSLGLAVAAVTFDAVTYVYGLDNGRDTIKSWTCRFQGSESAIELDSESVKTLSNDAFPALCAESTIDFWAMAIIVILQACSLVVAGLQWPRQRSPSLMERKTSHFLGKRGA